MISVTRQDPAGTTHLVHIRTHEVMVDMSVADGGGDGGPNPHDLYDSALGACKALTILWFAQRQNIPVEGIDVAVTRDSSGERGGVYRLSTLLTLEGDLTDDQRAKLLAVAAKCPVHKLMTEAETIIETELAPASVDVG
jgi:putative redox protein